MSSTSFRAPRRHNRRFPGSNGKRPDFAKDRREGALDRHMEASARCNGDEAKVNRIIKCIEGTKRTLVWVSNENYSY